MPKRPEPEVGQRRPMPYQVRTYDMTARCWSDATVMAQPAPRPRPRPKVHQGPAVVPMDLSSGNPMDVPHVGWAEDGFRPDDQKHPAPRKQYLKTRRVPAPWPNKHDPR